MQNSAGPFQGLGRGVGRSSECLTEKGREGGIATGLGPGTGFWERKWDGGRSCTEGQCGRKGLGFTSCAQLGCWCPHGVRAAGCSVHWGCVSPLSLGQCEGSSWGRAHGPEMGRPTPLSCHWGFSVHVHASLSSPVPVSPTRVNREVLGEVKCFGNGPLARPVCGRLRDLNVASYRASTLNAAGREGLSPRTFRTIPPLPPPWEQDPAGAQGSRPGTKDSMTTAVQRTLSTTQSWLQRIFKRKMLQHTQATVAFTYQLEIQVSRGHVGCARREVTWGPCLHYQRGDLPGRPIPCPVPRPRRSPAGSGRPGRCWAYCLRGALAAGAPCPQGAPGRWPVSERLGPDSGLRL